MTSSETVLLMEKLERSTTELLEVLEVVYPKCSITRETILSITSGILIGIKDITCKK